MADLALLAPGLAGGQFDLRAMSHGDSGPSWVGSPQDISRRFKGDEYPAALRNFFGLGALPEDRTRIEELMRESVPVLADDLKHKAATYLTQVILAGALGDQNERFLEYVSPMETPFTQIEFTELVFDNANMDEAPELAPPRYLTSFWNRWSTKYRRWNRGFFMENGFRLTDLGQVHYQSSMRVLALAVRNRFIQLGLYAFLNANQARQSLGEVNWRRFGFGFGGRNLRETLELSARYFGGFNKLENPTLRFISMAKEAIALRGGASPQFLAVPKGLAEYLEMERGDLYSYSQYGPTVAARKETGGELPVITAQRGIEVVEISPMQVTDQGPKLCPLTYDRWIGEFYTLGRHMRDVPSSQWNTSMADATIWNIETDQLERISYRNAVLRNCGLWGEDGELTEHIGIPYFASRGKANLDEWLRRFSTPEVYTQILEDLAEKADLDAFGDAGGAKEEDARLFGHTVTATGTKRFSGAEKIGKEYAAVVEKRAEQFTKRKTSDAAVRTLKLQLQELSRAGFAIHATLLGAYFELFTEKVCDRDPARAAKDTGQIIAEVSSALLEESRDSAAVADFVRRVLTVAVQPGAWTEDGKRDGVYPGQSLVAELGRETVNVEAVTEKMDALVAALDASKGKAGDKGAEAGDNDAEAGDKDARAGKKRGAREGADKSYSRENVAEWLKGVQVASITREWYSKWLEQNLYPFIGVLLLRADMRIKTQLMFFGSRGAVRVGYAKPRMELGTNTQQLYLEGHLVVYANGICFRPNDVEIVDNVRITQFEEGCNTSMWDLSKPSDIELYKMGGSPEEFRSIWAVPLFPGELLREYSVIDITGSVNENVAAPTALGPTPHFGMAPHFASLLGIQHMNEVYGPDTFIRDERRNTLCFRGWQVQSSGPGQYSVIAGTGHLAGEHHYPGKRGAMLGTGLQGGVRRLSLAEAMGTVTSIMTGPS